MNANIDQHADQSQRHPPATKTPMVTPVDPPMLSKAWFSSYDEEWAAFLAENSLRKSPLWIKHNDEDSPPCVWNMPL